MSFSARLSSCLCLPSSPANRGWNDSVTRAAQIFIGKFFPFPAYSEAPFRAIAVRPIVQRWPGILFCGQSSGSNCQTAPAEAINCAQIRHSPVAGIDGPPPWDKLMNPALRFAQSRDCTLTGRLVPSARLISSSWVTSPGAVFKFTSRNQ